MNKWFWVQSFKTTWLRCLAETTWSGISCKLVRFQLALFKRLYTDIHKNLKMIC